MSDTKRVVIVAYQFSVVVKGIERKLKEEGYQVNVLTENLDSIGAVADATDLFLMYLPGGIIGDGGKILSLGMVCTTIREKKKAMVLLGEKNDHADLEQHLSVIREYPWLDRPVDNNVLCEVIEKTLEGAGTDQGTAGADASGKKRILIVDDDPAYAGIVREWIKEYYKADVVTAGMQAITFLLKNKVDLILLDYEMPVVDGPQVLQMLRQEEVTAHIPVIFLTGNGTKEAVNRVMQLKPDGYILKTANKAGILGYLKKKLG